jgi:hypothetical protein
MMKLVGLFVASVALASGYFIFDILRAQPGFSAPPLHGKVAGGLSVPMPSTQTTAVAKVVLASRGSSSLPTMVQALPRTPPSDQPHPESSDVAVILDEKFRVDRSDDKESHRRKSTLNGIFEAAELGDDGRLKNLECKASLCRGEVELANKSKDNLVFERTLMSGAFLREVNQAVSITNRRTLSDGRVIATFFVHPDGALADLPSNPEEE